MVLDYLGFHPDIISWRRDNYEKRVEFFNFCASSGQGNSPYNLYLTGSKEDGTSIWDAGDEDWMVEVDKFVEEKDKLFVYKEENLLPGYTKLQLATQRHTAMHLLVVPCITPNGFVSSKLLNKAFYDIMRRAENYMKDTDFHRKKYDSFRLAKDNSDNPKVVFTFRTTTEWSWHTADIVPAFSYTSPDKYRNWYCRTRQQRWPPQRVKETVLQLPVHVVPKGQKGSESYDQEFRICYTYAEIELMKSLNETQTKVYVLLKLLFKSVINKKFPDIITSYVLKNVIFWISEQTPIDKFTNALLLYRFQTALKFIIQGIEEGNLPNYFIPERNLLLGRIRPENKAQLVDLLSEFVSCGCNCMYKIPAIEQGLHAISKDDFEYSRIYRNVVELLLVYSQMYWCYKRKSEIRDLANILMVSLLTNGADK